MSFYQKSTFTAVCAGILASASVPAAAVELAGIFKNQSGRPVVLRYQNPQEYQANLFLSCPTSHTPIYRLPIRQTKGAIELAHGDSMEVRLISSDGVKDGAQTATFNFVTWDAAENRAEGQIYFNFKQQSDGAANSAFSWMGTYNQKEQPTDVPSHVFRHECDDSINPTTEALQMDRTATVTILDRAKAAEDGQNA